MTVSEGKLYGPGSCAETIFSEVSVMILPGKKRGAAGFTLIEVLVAIIIFFVGLLALAKLQMSASLGNASAGNVTSATQAASSRMELLMCRDFSSLSSSGSVTESGFRITYNVTQPETGIKKIVLKVQRTGVVPITDTFETAVTDLQ